MYDHLVNNKITIDGIGVEVETMRANLEKENIIAVMSLKGQWALKRVSYSG